MQDKNRAKRQRRSKSNCTLCTDCVTSTQSGFVANNVDFIFICTFELGYFKAKSLPFSSFKSNDNA